ncbi:hypothetical protein [Actinoplanes xinjiangensis]|uniref:hypothetical protein n=1 Tax=Actinoplanes xinjiangensis TaxID=512350 RepID=UPI0034194959
MRQPDDLQYQGADVQDLVTLLLHAAMQAGDTLERLNRFTALCPEADLTSAADLAGAMRLMKGARATLIRCADGLAAGQPAR